jgi:hypothetical protein
MDDRNKRSNNKFLKISIFQVFDVLLEDSNTSFIIFFVVHVIEFFQILMFAFLPVFSRHWTNTKLYESVSTFLQNSWFNYIFNAYNNFNNYTIIFLIYFFINLLIVFDLIYILICLKKNYQIWSFAKLFLQFFSNIFNGILVIPMLDLFVVIYSCNGDQTKKMLSGTIKCFTDTLGYNILSIIGIFMVLGFSYLLSVLFFESNQSSKNIKARYICSYEKTILTTKIIWVLVLQFSIYLQESREWICSVFNLLFSLCNFIFLIKQKPFFNHMVQKILIIFRTIEFMTSLILVTSMVTTILII